MGKDHRRLVVWRKSYDFVLEMYNHFEKFPEEEKQNLVSQLRRAVVSIPLNIAEGSARTTKKSQLQFFNYAYGSCKEIQVLLNLSKDLKFLDEESFLRLFDDVDYLGKKLYKLMKSLDENKFFEYFEN